jgi:hypothetical protein
MEQNGTFLAKLLKMNIPVGLNYNLDKLKRKIWTIFASVLFISSYAAADGGDGSGGGFSCKINSNQRVLLDLNLQK